MLVAFIFYSIQRQYYPFPQKATKYTKLSQKNCHTFVTIFLCNYIQFLIKSFWTTNDDFSNEQIYNSNQNARNNATNNNWTGNRKHLYAHTKDYAFSPIFHCT